NWRFKGASYRCSRAMRPSGCWEAPGNVRACGEAGSIGRTREPLEGTATRNGRRGNRAGHGPIRGAADPRLLHLARGQERGSASARDRKSTRLNSSHVKISYAVFCLKKKKTT